jgi:hypothetical protein
MGKRSNFEHKTLQTYDTPASAIKPLLKHLQPSTIYCEPCAGAGNIVNYLTLFGHQCWAAYDVEPRASNVGKLDASFITAPDLKGAHSIITNPPWDRPVLHQIIERCSTLAPTWLLFDADWMHTKQAKPYLEICSRVVSIGRVKWIDGSASVGKENCCWYLFQNKPVTTLFFGQ